jgi:hypothetical protein
MRRLALFTALATLALAAVPAIAAAPTATLTIQPNKAGKGTTATLDIKLSKNKANPRSLTLRVVRGVKVDPRATAVKCTVQQANANNCPMGSKIGGGTNEATVSSTTIPPAFQPFQTTITTKLYLMAPLKQGDIAGSVAIFTANATGQKGHSFARITKIPQGQFGIQTKQTKLDTALTPPAGTKAHLDHIHLTYGATRHTFNKNGQPVTYNLIRNPKTCPGAWPYQIVLGYPSGNPSTINGSVACTP